MASRLPAVCIQVPGRECVPVSADHDFTTTVAVGARALKIMDIAGKDVTEPVLKRNFPGPFQRLNWRRWLVQHLPVGVEGCEV